MARRISTAPADRFAERQGSRNWLSTLLLSVAVVVAATPVVVGELAAVAAGYTAFGDQAVLAIRSGDVFGVNTPLLGMPSGTGEWSGVYSYHPGPLLFWLFAPFVELLGADVGPLIGMIFLGLASIVGIAVASYRHLGAAWAAALVALVPLTYLAAADPDWMYSPLNPIAAFLPFTCFVFLSWGVSRGDRALRPWWALFGSLVVQADLAYLPATAALAGAALLLSSTTLRGWHAQSAGRRLSARAIDEGELSDIGQQQDPQTSSVASGIVAGIAAGILSLSVVIQLPSSLAVACMISLAIALAFIVRHSHLRIRSCIRSYPTTVVLLTVWIVPLLQQILGRPGNLTSLIEAGTAATSTLGTGGAAGAIGTMAGNPRVLLDGLRADFQLDGLSSTALALSIGTLLLITTWAWRGNRTPTLQLCVLSWAAVIAAAIAGARLPEDYDLAHVIWIVPLSALFWVTVVVGVANAANLRPNATAVSAAILLLASTVILDVVTNSDRIPIAADEWHAWQHDAIPVLADALQNEVDPGSRVLVAGGGAPWLKALSIGLMTRLEASSTEVATHDIVNYLGSERDASNSEGVDASVWILEEPVPFPPPDSVMVGSYDPSSDPAAIDALAADIARFVRSSGGLVLSGDHDLTLRQVLFGRVPDVCPLEVDHGIECRTDMSEIDLDSLSGRMILDLYRVGHVASPALSNGLKLRIRQETTAIPVSVWVGPAPAQPSLLKPAESLPRPSGSLSTPDATVGRLGRQASSLNPLGEIVGWEIESP